MRLVAFIFSLLLALPASAHEVGVGDLVLHHAWSRASLGNSSNGAVYITIENRGTEAERLLSATTWIASDVMIHETIMNGDVASMQMADSLAIAPGEVLKLQPNGTHIMLLGLSQKLIEGETFPLTLTFEKAGEVTLDILIESATETGENLD